MPDLEKFVKNVMYGGIGAAASLVEKGGDLARSLVEKGQETVRNSQDTADDIKRRLQEFCDGLMKRGRDRHLEADAGTACGTAPSAGRNGLSGNLGQGNARSG